MEPRTRTLAGLVVTDFGGEGPEVVLVHGLGSSRAAWLPVGPRLAAAGIGHVLAPDLPGYGDSTPDGGPPGIPGHAAALSRFLDALEGPLWLVGSSMGGTLALLESAARPERVAGLVLVDAALPAPLADRLAPEVVGPFVGLMLPGLGSLRLRRHAARVGPEGLARYMLELCGIEPEALDPAVWRAQVEVEARRRRMPWSDATLVSSARTLIPRLALPRQVDMALAAVRAPTLLVHGGGDRLVPVSASQRARRRRPDFELVVLDGLGHMPHLQAPGRFLETVVPFVRAAGRAAARA